MSIIIFIIVLAVLILVHELGHFIIAKKSGIRVDEFGLGFPPKLISKKYGETEYSLNLIPFGGFVKIYGETPEAEHADGPDASRSLINKPKKIQAAVMAGGVLFNFLLAWLLLSVGFMSGLPMALSAAPAGAEASDVALTIVGVLPDSPASRAELKTGDEIVSLSVDSETISPIEAIEVSEFVSSHSDSEITFVLNRGDEEISKILTPTTGIVEGNPAVGISMERVGMISLSPIGALIAGARYTVELSIMMVVMLAQIIADLVTGESVGAAIVGPVGIVGLVGDAASLGFVYLLTFTALISINLAIINLIPFPALDGGRLLFILIEAIKGSPIKPQIANTLNLIGFSLLILLMLVVTFNDIARLF